MTQRPVILSSLLAAALAGCTTSERTAMNPTYDVIIRSGMIYDGSGGAPFAGDVAITRDAIVAVGNISNARGRRELDATGLAVAPGFINMLSWATESLLHDGRSQSNIRQGVTLEIMGEGESMGPLNAKMKRDVVAQQADIKYDVKWTTLGSIWITCRARCLVQRRVLHRRDHRPIHELGHADRAPSPAELERMQGLVQQAMEEGALGLASALIYAPGFYAKTDELIALAKVAGQHGGIYISHLRSEGNRLLESTDELIMIAREARIPAEIYHLKAAGQANWAKLGPLLKKIEAARAAGLQITADMYCYTAAATGLDAAMPPWVQEGGYESGRTFARPADRQRVVREMTTPSDEWETFFCPPVRRRKFCSSAFATKAQTADRQDARGSRAARQIARGNRH
jgi:N-acyl-D-amino-acid deacylase